MTNRAYHYIVFWVSFFSLNTSEACEYFFIKYEGETLTPVSVSAEFGNYKWREFTISKNGARTYGPVPCPVPRSGKITWAGTSNTPIEKVIELKSEVPREFRSGDTVLFQVGKDGRLATHYLLKVDKFRIIEVPVDETKQQAALRELNEALLYAAGRGSIDLVNELIDKGANVNYNEQSIYVTPLRFAANGKHYKVVELLLSKGARIRASDLRSDYLKEIAQSRGLTP